MENNDNLKPDLEELINSLPTEQSKKDEFLARLGEVDLEVVLVDVQNFIAREQEALDQKEAALEAENAKREGAAEAEEAAAEAELNQVLEEAEAETAKITQDASAALDAIRAEELKEELKS